MLKEYDPKKFKIIVGTKALSGFADGTFIKVGRNAVAWTMLIGASGEGARARQNDKSGFIEVTLMQTSDDNAYLSAVAIADEQTGAGIIPCLIKDNGGNSVHQAAQCFIEKIPDDERGKDVGSVIWRLLAPALDLFPAGSNSAVNYSA